MSGGGVTEGLSVVDEDWYGRELERVVFTRCRFVDVDMTDQRQRWGAFSHLATIDPWRQRQTDGTPYAAATVVLRHTTGARFVRCGWFYTYARTLDLGVGQAELAHRMQRAGWQRRGTRGAIKATAPDRHAELSWTFYTVPAQWQETAR